MNQVQAFTAACIAVACLHAASHARAEGVPEWNAVATARGQTLLESLAARGVQVYECRVDAAAPGGARWVFVAPQAELFDRTGRLVGTHFAGPQWQAADGSRIAGELQARADAPQADAIPWLLLSAKSVGADGRFARVTSVQRVNTRGGQAPRRACDAAAAGETERVPYTADYLLYVS